jgi:hypothetical protein
MDGFIQAIKKLTTAKNCFMGRHLSATRRKPLDTQRNGGKISIHISLSANVLSSIANSTSVKK